MSERRSSRIAISIEMPRRLLQQVDTWAAAQKPPATRGGALHRLLQIGLASTDPAAKAPRTGKNSKRSAGMAGDVIDSLEDQSATAADRAHRKTRLLDGPEEFRRLRRDGHIAKGTT